MNSYKSYKAKNKLPTRVQPEVMPEPGDAGLYTNKIHYLRKYLLDELITKKFAMDFMEPVDTTILLVPSYYAVIKRPMDVGTIIKRVQNRYYHRVEELIRDFRLVISNCYTFNRPGEVVYRNCQKLEKFFHRVINKMPKGEEKPSTKDPRSSGKQHGLEKASDTVQRLCHEHLRKLHESISREEDIGINRYFSAKLEYLSQKVDRYYYKSIEEFRFEVNTIFKNFDNQLKLFHGLFHKTCNPQQRFPHCPWPNEQNDKSQEPEELAVKLDKRDVVEVIFALKRAENSVEHCFKGYTKEKERRAKGLIEAFDAAAERLKQKLNRGRKDIKSREERNREMMNEDQNQQPSPSQIAENLDQSSDEESSDSDHSKCSNVNQWHHERASLSDDEDEDEEEEEDSKNNELSSSLYHRPGTSVAVWQQKVEQKVATPNLQVSFADRAKMKKKLKKQLKKQLKMQMVPVTSTVQRVPTASIARSGPKLSADSMLWTDLQLTSSDDST